MMDRYKSNVREIEAPDKKFIPGDSYLQSGRSHCEKTGKNPRLLLLMKIRRSYSIEFDVQYSTVNLTDQTNSNDYAKQTENVALLVAFGLVKVT